MANEAFTQEDLDNFFSTEIKLQEIEPEILEEKQPDEVVTEEPEIEESVDEEEVKEESEEEEEEEVETEADYKKRVHQGLAKALSTKYGYDVDETKIETIDDLAEVFEQLNNVVLTDMWETTKNANEKIKSVFDVLEQGGDIKDLMKIFEEETKVIEIDLNDRENLKKLVTKFYTEEMGLTADKAKRYIASLELNDEEDELLAEGKDIQKKYEDKFKKEREEKAQQAKEVQEKRDRIKNENIKNIATYLQQQKLPQNRIKEVVDFAYTEAYSMGNEKLTKLDVEILKRQQDPQKIVSLIEFLQDEDAYVKKKASEVTTKKTDSTFKAILANQIAKKTGAVSETSKLKKQTFTLDDFGLVKQ